ncbi:MAG TPA: class I SAM-dependent methyltransferase [Methylosinus sp.]
MSQSTPEGDDALYPLWKKWDRPFAYTAEEAAYFTGETRDLAISGAEVLEIGFGSGAFLAWARARGARVAGVEINSVLQEAARREAIELLSPDLEAAARDHAGRFDTIVAFDVFEHLRPDDLVPALRATCAMLKPGGRLALRFPNGQSPFGLAPQHGDPTHRSALSKALLEYHLQALPLDCVRYGGVYRIGAAGLKRRVGRWARGLLQDALGAALNALYASDIPFDPVVVLVLARRCDEPRDELERIPIARTIPFERKTL